MVGHGVVWFWCIAENSFVWWLWYGIVSVVGYGVAWWWWISGGEQLCWNVGWLWEIAVVSICMHQQRVAPSNNLIWLWKMILYSNEGKAADMDALHESQFNRTKSPFRAQMLTQVRGIQRVALQEFHLLLKKVMPYSKEVKEAVIFVPSYSTGALFSISCKPCLCLNEKHIQHISYGWLHKRATITMIGGGKTETKPRLQEAVTVVREGGLSRWVDKHTVLSVLVSYLYLYLCLCLCLCLYLYF